MATGFVVRIDYKALRGEFQSRGQGGRWIRMVGRQMLILSKNEAPSRSGGLRRSHGMSKARIGMGWGNQYSAAYGIYASAKHAEYVHMGTTAITAKGGGKMRLAPGNGYGVLYRRMVRGQKANPWLDRACTRIAIRYGGVPVG